MSSDRQDAWPGAEPYARLKTVHPAQLAWEWVRRDPDYQGRTPSGRRRTSSGVLIIEPAPLDVQRRWGCLHIEDGHASVAEVPVLWTGGVDASVLRVVAVADRGLGATSFDLDSWGERAIIVPEAEGEHLLLREGQCHIRLYVESGFLLRGAVSLHFVFDPADSFEPSLDTLRRFLHLMRTGCWLAEPPLSDRERTRAIIALRVHDALVMGASLRDLALMLFGEARVAEDWRAPGEAMKSQCRRWKALARGMANGGYRKLLG